MEKELRKSELLDWFVKEASKSKNDTSWLTRELFAKYDQITINPENKYPD